MILSGHELKTRSDALLAVAILVTGIACILIPAWQLMDPGPFKWHVAQPAFWQGGIETLVLVCLLASAQLLRTHTLRLILTLIVAELYLRRHAVDAAVAVDLVYFELCVALGAFVMRLNGNTPPQSIPEYLASFIMGLCVWSVCAWAISAIGLGSLHDLRWMTLLLFIPAFTARSRPWALFVHKGIDGMPRLGRICASVLFGWFLVQFARSAVAIDFDSLWYGLRGQYVLVGSGSAFASSGLVSPVYYFPKLYELFLIPLSGLGSSSAITGMTLLIATMLAAAGYEVLKRLGINACATRFVGILVCITVPAVANQVLQAKGDILAAFLLTFAWIKASEFIAARNRASLIWFFGLLLLATQARLSAIPFVGAMTMAVLLAWLFRPTDAIPSEPRDLRLAWISLGLAGVVVTFVTARTLLLAGMPTIGPDPLFNLWQMLGFQLKFPAGTLHWSYPKDWSDIFPLATDFLFRPQRLSHIQISWVGNVWVWLAAVAMFATLAVSKRPALPFSVLCPGLSLVLAAIILMLCWGYQIRGGDGNYFITGLLSAVLLGFAAAWNTVSAFPKARFTFVACIGAFCLFQVGYGFMSAAWTTGTRPFDLLFDRGVHEFRKRERNIAIYYGIERIADYLRDQRGVVHVVGYVDDDPAFSLHAVFEDLASVSYARRELVDNRALFLKYLVDTKVKYLIMPREPFDPKSDATRYVSPMIASLAREIEMNPSSLIIRDTHYDMYDIAMFANH